ncbi:ABC-ATPase domain-containing protein [Eubacterium sp. An3]|uniref:ABC-ATPase domain-containing protein n=1 Tax=Eubacterium sp. An3 TaxID=1965628 RepID=UPI000B37B387|nr:ABC-ATPase domain-containing protein [Eubacterium sp. An3]OUO29146.1 isopentenyl-diphosphate delta-isomerase [Eubacterium sp. An3]
MNKIEELRRVLQRIDHKSYGMYKSLAGAYDCGKYVLYIDHVQGDPFASPSRLRFEIRKNNHGFPEEYWQDKHRRLALEDQVLRRFNGFLRKMDRGNMGSGKSGRITTCRTGQKVLERIAVVFSENKMELRFEMGFPARGRSILADEMIKLLFDTLPKLAEGCLFYNKWDAKSRQRLQDAVFLADDQKALREELEKRKLAAFVADGAILPRESGISDLPMKGAVAFQSPETLRTQIRLPHKGVITGMGIPEGITVIVGGGYHGKSTLLKALEQGVYNHIAGDGREYVLARDYAMKIRAEDGRSVLHTDISMFINHLPNGQDTTDFSTENASGSTSQAANLVEALEAGSRLMLLDEDTSATNFMIRDKVMARLVSDDREPITTLLRHIRSLYERHGVSFVIVVGSSGDYLSVADHVLQMDRYEVKDVTEAAGIICREEWIEGQYPAGSLDFPDFTRALKPAGAGRMKMKAMGTDTVMIDRDMVDVRYLEQLADDGQTVGLAYLMGWILANQRQKTAITSLLDDMYRQIEKKGLQTFIPPNYSCGHPVLPRKQELFACLNRYRKAKIVRE